MKTIKVGFLGCGNIGSGVYQLMEEMAGQLAHRHGLRFEVQRILVRDLDKPRDAAIPKALMTIDPKDILSDPEITLVAEFMGGEEPASSYISQALQAGKQVVTANKMALALNWHTFRQAAAQGGGGLSFEASVCGAVPIIRTLNDSLQSNQISRLMGIVNGTTNYMLSAMADSGQSYEQALQEAQRLGYAEPDPTSDVEGHDAVYKLSILASLAFHARIPADRVYREGISQVSALDISFGRDLDYALKLLAIAKREGEQVELRVHPTFVSQRHPLASVRGTLNAVYLEGSACQEMMLLGRGAGSGPTASAIVSDMIFASLHPGHPGPSFENTAVLPDGIQVLEDWESGYYIRFSAVDQPGVLGHIATCFGRHGINIESLMQRGDAQLDRVPVVLVSHRAKEMSIRAAVAAMDSQIVRTESLIRVEI